MGRGVRWHHRIRSGEFAENGFAESLDGRIREDCLNQHFCHPSPKLCTSSRH
jgi:hypothetical protein